MFRALLLDQSTDGVTADVVELDDDRLPDGDVTVDVEWSSLNYKDGLILKGLGRLVRDYPHVPGIDLAGTVSASADARYSAGDRVVLTGWRVGEVWWGGYASKARVKGDWLSPLPDGLTSAVYFSMREEDVRYALSLPWTTIGSDGYALAPEGILARGHPHPRSYGTFPRVLARYVREQNALTLSEAIRKMTSLPASRLGLADRGSVAVGKKADLVVFDAGRIIDHANYARPHRLAEGVRHLIVNGETVIRNGAHTGARPGRVLRHRSGG